MTPSVVMLESPYAGNTFSNCAYARRCMRDSILRGEAPFASHLLYPQQGILDDEIQADRNLGLTLAEAWAARADYTVFYTDLGWSAGMSTALFNRCLKLVGTEVYDVRQHFTIRALDGPVTKLPSAATLKSPLYDLLLQHIEE